MPDFPSQLFLPQDFRYHVWCQESILHVFPKAKASIMIYSSSSSTSSRLSLLSAWFNFHRGIWLSLPCLAWVSSPDITTSRIIHQTSRPTTSRSLFISVISQARRRLWTARACRHGMAQPLLQWRSGSNASFSLHFPFFYPLYSQCSR